MTIPTPPHECFQRLRYLFAACIIDGRENIDRFSQHPGHDNQFHLAGFGTGDQLLGPFKMGRVVSGQKPHDDIGVEQIGGGRHYLRPRDWCRSVMA